MFESHISAQESFLLGVVAATLGWIGLSVCSALVLGRAIRRANGATDREELEAQDAATKTDEAQRSVAHPHGA